MQPTIFIKPTKGSVVRDPATRRPIPEEGQQVVQSQFWLRRLKDGSVVEAKAPKAATPSTGGK